MKTIALLFCLLLNPLFMLAQTDQEAAQKAFETYFDVLNTRDYDRYLDYIYPKLFELAPRAALEAAIKKQFSDTTIVLSMDNAKISQVSDVLVHKKVKYVLLDYEFDMHMTTKNPEDKTYEVAQTTYEIFKEMYGEENVQYDGKNHFDIHSKKQSFGILDPSYDGWKFLDNNKNPMIQQLLPKKVLKKLK